MSVITFIKTKFYKIRNYFNYKKLKNNGFSCYFETPAPKQQSMSNEDLQEFEALSKELKNNRNNISSERKEYIINRCRELTSRY